MRSIRSLQGAVIIGILAAGAAVQADTVATFADISPDPIFTVEPDLLSGKGDGLALQAPLTDELFEDVTFSMTDLGLSGQKAAGGSIEFRSSTDELLLRIEFDNATFTSAPTAFGAGSQSGDNVRFSGSIVPAALVLENEQFSFGLTNPMPTNGGTSYTAAFSSSADIVEDGGSGDGGTTDGGTTDGGTTDGGTTDGGTTDGGTTDGGTTDGGDGTGDGVPDDMVPAGGCAPMCAMGMMPMVPGMFIGLGLMKLRARRRA